MENEKKYKLTDECITFDDRKLYRIVRLSSPKFTLVDYPTMDDRLRNKELKSSDRLKQEINVFH